MDVQDQISKTDGEIIAHLASEYGEVFDWVRRFCRNDMHAWMLVPEVFDHWDRQRWKKHQATEQTSESQVKALGKRGIKTLSDLTKKQANLLLNEINEESW